MATGLLPLHLNLAERRVVVAGGGRVAARKVRALLAAGADVLVVSPQLGAELEHLLACGQILWRRGPFRDSDLDDAWVAVAATGSLPVDRAVSAAADRRRLFCVRADEGVRGSARMPAVLHRDDLVVSVSGTGAADPHRVVAVRNFIAEHLDTGAVPLRRVRPGPGRVVVIAAGRGDVDLMTVRGRRELAAADVVVLDGPAPSALLEVLQPGVLVEKPGSGLGRSAATAVLIAHARAGRRVVRLITGNGVEPDQPDGDTAACLAAGFGVTLVPGVDQHSAVVDLPGRSEVFLPG